MAFRSSVAAAFGLLALACSSPVLDVICDPKPPAEPTAACVRGRGADAGAAPGPVFPSRTEMALGLYAIERSADMQAARASGWNLGHSHATTPTSPAFLATCATQGLRVLARLAGTTEPIPEADAIADIQRLAGSDAVLWWDLPEAMRYWRTGEMEIVRSYARLTRAHDPQRRPVYMYIPGHYDAAAVASYVPYLDIVPAAVYPELQDQPRAWARWRVETTIAGIRMANARVGADHMAGEKTPVAILQLFAEDGGRVPTAAGVTHDLWQALVSGARGVMVSSFAGRDDTPELAAAWQRLDESVKWLAGAEGLARVVLDGGPPASPITATVLSGPSRTPTFEPWHAEGATPTTVSYASIDLMARVFGGSLYVIAVSSAEAAVEAKLAGLPTTASQGRLLLQDRAVTVADGVVDLAFDPLGVVILKVPLPPAAR